MSQDKFIN